MSKISGLPHLPCDAIKSDVPAVKNAITRRAALGMLAAPAILQAATACAAPRAASDSGRQSSTERNLITRAPGIVGDGVTDDSLAIMNFMSENKGKIFTFPRGRRFLFGNILMAGRSWNGTRIVVEEGCECILSPRNGAPATLHGAWAMFGFQETDGCRVDVRGWLNGNRANQPDNTNIHLMMLAGVEDFKLPSFRVREYQGDGLYVTNQNQFAPYGRNSKRLTAGSIYGVNSAPAGRNLVSIISLEDAAFATITGINVGGFVQGSYQPGGFDIEPNHAGQLVKNIVVDSINVSGQGQSMIAVHGRPERTDITRGVVIARSRAINLIPATAKDQAGNLTQNGGTTLKLRWCEDVAIGDHAGHHRASHGIGVEMVLVTRPKVRARVSRVHTALATSAGGTVLKTITDPDIVVDANDICRYGHSLTDIKGGRIGGRLSDPTDGTYYAGGRFGVIGTAGGTLANTVLSVSMAGHRNWTRSYRHDGAVYADAVIADCDLSGSAWAGQVQQVGDMQVPRRNVAGVTGMARKPVGGNWKAGDFVAATVATAASGKALLGWKRLTNGNRHVLDTDWKAVWGRR